MPLNAKLQRSQSWARSANQLIVVASTPPPLHGASVMAAALLDCLRTSGRLAHHVNTSDGGDLTSLGRFDWSNVTHGLRNLFELCRALCHHRGASVYVAISQERTPFLRDAIFLTIARLVGRPRIVHLHSGAFARFVAGEPRIVRFMIRAVLRGAEAWVLTPSLRSEFDGIVPAERRHVLENAVSEQVARAATTFEEVGERVRILYMSNWIVGKGVSVFLDALEMLEPLWPSMDIRVAGDTNGPIAADVRARIARLAEAGLSIVGLSVLRGPEKSTALAWADVFAFPPTGTRSEGQPLVILEAMAAGLAIVSTYQGGIADTARPDSEALLVRPEDPTALASALARVVKEPALRKRLSSAAQERYLEHYSLPAFCHRVQVLLEDHFASGVRS